MYRNHQNDQLGFLKEKIGDIKIALFKSEIDSGLQLPNNIIQTLKVEDDGTIWFFTSCNGNNSECIDSSFYAYLNYYKKGTDYRLHVSGRATIAENDDETLFTMSNCSKGVYSRLVLVKLKIMQAEFFENKSSTNMSVTRKIKTAFNHLFLTPAEGIYDFS
jgi:general stress protein 26